MKKLFCLLLVPFCSNAAAQKNRSPYLLSSEPFVDRQIAVGRPKATKEQHARALQRMRNSQIALLNASDQSAAEKEKREHEIKKRAERKSRMLEKQKEKNNKFKKKEAGWKK